MMHKVAVTQYLTLQLCTVASIPSRLAFNGYVMLYDTAYAEQRKISFLGKKS
jgi:hypothetical protein